MNAIGLMVAGYIILKCCEVWGRPASSFSSSGARIALSIAALVCALVAGVVGMEMLISTMITSSARQVTQQDIDAERNRREVEEMLRRNR